jgi:hypothetical protein
MIEYYFVSLQKIFCLLMKIKSILLLIAATMLSSSIVFAQKSNELFSEAFGMEISPKKTPAILQRIP